TSGIIIRGKLLSLFSEQEKNNTINNKVIIRIKLITLI
ncbi:MAG: hypothetical protein ACI924_001667, partial [Flavobacterium sp.]